MTTNSAQQDPFFIPNILGRLLLQAYEEVMSREGIIELHTQAGLNHFIQDLPPENLEPGFCADDMGLLHQSLEEIYGIHAGRGIALRAGRVCFKYGLKDFGETVGISESDFRLLPLSKKIERGFYTLSALAQEYTPTKIEIEQTPNTFSWKVERCPLCWQRKVEEACCHLAVGLFQEALFWISGGKNYLVEEIACVAAGDRTCTFEITRNPLD
jgi:predicted hydrocarbon binding protein